MNGCDPETLRLPSSNLSGWQVALLKVEQEPKLSKPWQVGVDELEIRVVREWWGWKRFHSGFYGGIQGIPIPIPKTTAGQPEIFQSVYLSQDTSKIDP